MLIGPPANYPDQRPPQAGPLDRFVSHSVRPRPWNWDRAPSDHKSPSTTEMRAIVGREAQSSSGSQRPERPEDICDLGPKDIPDSSDSRHFLDDLFDVSSDDPYRCYADAAIQHGVAKN
jgi:hypothetical protein